MELTEKQQDLASRAIAMFKDKGLEKTDAILQKAKVTYDVELQDYTDQMVFDLFNDVVYNPEESNLYAKCIVPPFTTLDSRQGEWLNRRRLLDDYLGSSLIGREAGLAYGKMQERDFTESGKVDNLLTKVRKDDNGTSKFDSVLCEVLLKWFGFPGCQVLDPFAGGHIRGAMAKLVGYDYLGIDLSEEQVEANRKRAEELGLNVQWITGDALEVLPHLADGAQDLIFTCPPYGDLEQYTDDPRDLSNMDYEAFILAYKRILELSMAKLKDNRFAVIVVGDFRDKQGFYRGFVADTIKIMEAAGAKLYNEAILLNSIGTASMRASGMFGNRKLAKVHQNVLVFYKGDPKEISSNYKTVDNKLPVPIKTQKALF